MMFGVDVGGTFTDVVAIKDGKVVVTKVPSVPDNPQTAVIEGARRLGVEDAKLFNHASTKGLNAVITRKLPKIGFLTTDGHRDILDGGRAWRPFDNQMNPSWRRPFGDAARPLVPRYLRRSIVERVLADGSVLIPLDEHQVRQQLRVLGKCKVEGIAICLLNAYLNGSHEQRLLALIREELGDIPVSLSSVASPRAKEFSRAMTTVIDVFMKLVYGPYAEKLDSGLRQLGFTGELNFADCTAALSPWRMALQKPHRIVFAGPAAGVASCQRLGEAIGERNLICCDVGGTSTDVALIVNGACFVNDSLELEFDMVVNALSTEVASVGAGGGSIVRVAAAGDIEVGPDSAGAAPGPACYDRGGVEPTVTDACLLIGILDASDFADGQLQLQSALAEAAFAKLNTPLTREQRIGYAFRIAINNIAEEVTNVAIRHGCDPRDFSLVAYGAAGPMLLAGVLELLKLKQVIVPPHPGLFSALGLLATDMVYSESRSAYRVLAPDNAAEIQQLYEEMEQTLREHLPEGAECNWQRSFDGRLLGQSWETPFVPAPGGVLDAAALAQMCADFHREYQRRNGQAFVGMPVQGVSYRVQATVKSAKFEYNKLPLSIDATAVAVGERELHCLGNASVKAKVFRRAQLPPGCTLTGPAIVQEPLATILILPGQAASVGSCGELIIRLVEAAA